MRTVCAILANKTAMKTVNSVLSKCSNPVCNNIAKDKKFKCCGRCKCFFYCSKECQTHHWPEHKKTCSSDIWPKEYRKLSDYGIRTHGDTIQKFYNEHKQEKGPGIVSYHIFSLQNGTTHTIFYHERSKFSKDEHILQIIDSSTLLGGIPLWFLHNGKNLLTIVHEVEKQ